MDTVTRLEAIEEIKQLKGRYFLHLDTKNFDEWGRLFTPDVVMDVSSHSSDPDNLEPFIYRGVERILATVPASLAGIATAHHGHTPLITVHSAETASGIWAMEDNLMMPDGARMQGYGHYHEDYRKTEGGWKISHTTLTRIKVIMLPPPR